MADLTWPEAIFLAIMFGAFTAFGYSIGKRDRDMAELVKDPKIMVNEVFRGGTHTFMGIEISVGTDQVGTRTYFIDKDQKFWPGARVGTFPHPGLGNPEWIREVVYERSLKEGDSP